MIMISPLLSDLLWVGLFILPFQIEESGVILQAKQKEKARVVPIRRDARN